MERTRTSVGHRVGIAGPIALFSLLDGRPAWQAGLAFVIVFVLVGLLRGAEPMTDRRKMIVGLVGVGILLGSMAYTLVV